MFSLNHLQTLIGHHGHSVWGIDVRNDFLVTASADKSLNVWQNDPISKLWNFKHKMDNDEAPLRNVIILKKLPFLALSGDLLGDLKIWNLDSGKNCLFIFTVEKFLLSNFLWSHTPLFGHILLYVYYKMRPKSGV